MTDNMAEIFISFEKDDILQSGIVYQFGISNPQGTKSPRDQKVRNTILAIIEEFFYKNLAFPNPYLDGATETKTTDATGRRIKKMSDNREADKKF